MAEAINHQDAENEENAYPYRWITKYFRYFNQIFIFAFQSALSICIVQIIFDVYLIC